MSLSARSANGPDAAITERGTCSATCLREATNRVKATAVETIAATVALPAQITSRNSEFLPRGFGSVSISHVGLRPYALWRCLSRAPRISENRRVFVLL